MSYNTLSHVYIRYIHPLHPIHLTYPAYPIIWKCISYISYLSISIHIYPYLSYISQIYTLIYTNIIYTSNEIHKSSPALAQGSVLGISLSSCEPRKSAKPRPRNGRIYEGSTKDLPSPCSWDYNGPIHGF
jgi:hypothetical protein